MEGGVVMCGSCGMERQWMVSECKLCEVLARNVALEEEVKEVKISFAQTWQQMLEVRREASVRARASGQRQGEDSWRVVDGFGSFRAFSCWYVSRFAPFFPVRPVSFRAYSRSSLLVSLPFLITPD